ncbi:hypothetical protein HNR46_002371 [Haloferula luteola]|uniref:Uncharacterized protein n=1 Tax=Haloferula luteola TaxID=595692 RepID=A0A840VE32_9BACT|nr:hypothetical protein [Haloferula luteola]
MRPRCPDILDPPMGSVGIYGVIFTGCLGEGADASSYLTQGRCFT